MVRNWLYKGISLLLCLNLSLILLVSMCSPVAGALLKVSTIQVEEISDNRVVRGYWVLNYQMTATEHTTVILEPTYQTSEGMFVGEKFSMIFEVPTVSGKQNPFWRGTVYKVCRPFYDGDLDTPHYREFWYYVLGRDWLDLCVPWHAKFKNENTGAVWENTFLFGGKGTNYPKVIQPFASEPGFKVEGLGIVITNFQIPSDSYVLFWDDTGNWRLVPHNSFISAVTNYDSSPKRAWHNWYPTYKDEEWQPGPYKPIRAFFQNPPQKITTKDVTSGKLKLHFSYGGYWDDIDIEITYEGAWEDGRMRFRYWRDGEWRANPCGFYFQLYITGDESIGWVPSEGYYVEQTANNWASLWFEGTTCVITMGVPDDTESTEYYTIQFYGPVDTPLEYIRRTGLKTLQTNSDAKRRLLGGSGDIYVNWEPELKRATINNLTSLYQTYYSVVGGPGLIEQNVTPQFGYAMYAVDMGSYGLNMAVYAPVSMVKTWIYRFPNGTPQILEISPSPIEVKGVEGGVFYINVKNTGPSYDTFTCITTTQDLNIENVIVAGSDTVSINANENRWIRVTLMSGDQHENKIYRDRVIRVRANGSNRIDSKTVDVKVIAYWAGIPPPQEYWSLYVFVFDVDTLTPIQGATVTVIPDGLRPGVTNNDGLAIIQINPSPGNRSVTASKPGYNDNTIVVNVTKNNQDVSIGMKSTGQVPPPPPSPWLILGIILGGFGVIYAVIRAMTAGGWGGW